MNSTARRMAVLASLALSLAACSQMTGPVAPQGRVAYGVTDTNRLATFGTDNPRASLTTRAFTGLAAGETIVGFDFEPGTATRAGGTLIAVSNASRMYSVNLGTGALTAIGSASFTPQLRGSSFGIDFNPVPNRVRVHTNEEQNLRLNQETGVVVDANTTTPAVIDEDGALAYASADVRVGSNPSIVGTAYTNSVSGATSTTLFAIDAAADALVKVDPPNAGVLLTVGSLGVNTTDDVGFDISARADGTAFATLTPSGATTSSLYTIDLSTGVATLKGNVGVVLRGIALAP